MSRRIARQAALFALYSYSMRGETDAAQCRPSKKNSLFKDCLEISENDFKFARKLFDKALSGKEQIDEIIQYVSTNWDIDRISVIDKNIIRLALTEFLFFPEIGDKVTINESIELAKDFGGEDSSRFINGILDAVISKNIGVGKVE